MLKVFEGPPAATGPGRGWGQLTPGERSEHWNGQLGLANQAIRAEQPQRAVNLALQLLVFTQEPAAVAVVREFLEEEGSGSTSNGRAQEAVVLAQSQAEKGNPLAAFQTALAGFRKTGDANALVVAKDLLSEVASSLLPSAPPRAPEPPPVALDLAAQRDLQLPATARVIPARQQLAAEEQHLQLVRQASTQSVFGDSIAEATEPSLAHWAALGHRERGKLYSFALAEIDLLLEQSADPFKAFEVGLEFLEQTRDASRAGVLLRHVLEEAPYYVPDERKWARSNASQTLAEANRLIDDGEGLKALRLAFGAWEKTGSNDAFLVLSQELLGPALGAVSA